MIDSQSKLRPYYQLFDEYESDAYQYIRKRERSSRDNRCLLELGGASQYGS